MSSSTDHNSSFSSIVHDASAAPGNGHDHDDHDDHDDHGDHGDRDHDDHDHDDHDHDDHDHDDHGGASPSTLKGYMTGFVLAVILTVIPFWLVLGKVLPSASTTGLVILGIAAVQIVVHMIYFLHMNTRSQGGWSLLALAFTVVLVVIMLAGSIWVMYHLNSNMMPSMSDMKNMP